jgi:hypothetical protein
MKSVLKAVSENEPEVMRVAAADGLMFRIQRRFR